jgi:hypothetical protein
MRSTAACEWGSRAKGKHYSVEDLKKRTPSERNVVRGHSINAATLFLPPLHIEFGLVKNYVIALKQDDPFLYL